jgi:hypothetical protein
MTITVNFWLYLQKGKWGNGRWKLSRKLLPAYQLVTHLAHSNQFRQSNSLHDIDQNACIKERLRTGLEWIGCHSSREIAWGCDVQCCGEATGIIHLFQEKQPVDLDNIRTARVAVEYCSNQVRILLQTDLIWNFTIVVLPFLMQFFSLPPDITITLLAVYWKYWRDSEHFVLRKVSK